MMLVYMLNERVTSELCWLCSCRLSCSGCLDLSISSESTLDAEAELMLERDECTMDLTSCSMTVPTEPVRRWCWWAGLLMVEEEYGAEAVEARDAVLRCAASSMLCEARSSWAVMSSREKLEASAGLMVDAGDTRVLLLLLLPPLPPLLPPLPPVCFTLWLRPAGGFWRTLASPVRPRRADPLLGLPMVLSSCSIEHRSAIRASRSTESPWFRASVRQSKEEVHTHLITGSQKGLTTSDHENDLHWIIIYSIFQMPWASTVCAYKV